MSESSAEHAPEADFSESIGSKDSEMSSSSSSSSSSDSSSSSSSSSPQLSKKRKTADSSKKKKKGKKQKSEAPPPPKKKKKPSDQPAKQPFSFPSKLPASVGGKFGVWTLEKVLFQGKPLSDDELARAPSDAPLNSSISALLIVNSKLPGRSFFVLALYQQDGNFHLLNMRQEKSLFQKNQYQFTNGARLYSSGWQKAVLQHYRNRIPSLSQYGEWGLISDRTYLNLTEESAAEVELEARDDGLAFSETGDYVPQQFGVQLTQSNDMVEQTLALAANKISDPVVLANMFAELPPDQHSASEEPATAEEPVPKKSHVAEKKKKKNTPVVEEKKKKKAPVVEEKKKAVEEKKKVEEEKKKSKPVEQQPMKSSSKPVAKAPMNFCYAAESTQNIIEKKTKSSELNKFLVDDLWNKHALRAWSTTQLPHYTPQSEEGKVLCFIYQIECKKAGSEEAFLQADDGVPESVRTALGQLESKSRRKLSEELRQLLSQLETKTWEGVAELKDFVRLARAHPDFRALVENPKNLFRISQTEEELEVSRRAVQKSRELLNLLITLYYHYTKEEEAEEKESSESDIEF